MASLRHVCILAALLTVATEGVNRLKRGKRETSEEVSANPMCNRQNGHLMPHIFMLGMQKAGSSSIWRNLVDCFPIERGAQWSTEPLWMKKELHYFDDDERYNKGFDFYTSHFPECASVDATHRAIDGTPNYFTEGARTAERLVETYGERKSELHFVLVVRDPVKRMEAGYWHFMPGHAGGFEQFVDRSLVPAENWAARGFQKADVPWEPNPYHGSLYGKYLQEYLKFFEPRQFSVVTLDQYASDPQKVMSFLANRMQIRQTTTLTKPEHRNEREHPSMNFETKAKLDRFFKDDQDIFNSLVMEHCMAMDCKSSKSDF